MLKLRRPLISIDIEGTGPDPVKDAIIELALIKYIELDGALAVGSDLIFRCHPGRPIPKESTEVHGITDADVANLPPFEKFAEEVKAFIDGCDFLGYNLTNYDIPILSEALSYCGMQMNLDGVLILDPSVIFKKMEPRDLSSAVMKYAGYEHKGAHGARADAIATMHVLCGQIDQYPNLNEMTLDQLAEFSKMDPNRIDLAGKFIMKDGVACYNFGDKRGLPVSIDGGSLARWLLGKDFTEDTKRHADRILRENYEADQARYRELGDKAFP